MCACVCMYQCVDSPDIRHPCSRSPLREPFAKRQCGVLLSEVFQLCHPVVSTGMTTKSSASWRNATWSNLLWFELYSNICCVYVCLWQDLYIIHWPKKCMCWNFEYLCSLCASVFVNACAHAHVYIHIMWVTKQMYRSFLCFTCWRVCVPAHASMCTCVCAVTCSFSVCYFSCPCRWVLGWGCHWLFESEL